MGIRKLLFVAIGCSGLFWQPPITAQTLQEAIHTAINQTPDYLTRQANQKALRGRLREAYGGYLPNLDIAAAYGRDKNNNVTTRTNSGGSLTLTRREASFTLTQMLFDGFAVRSDVEGSAARLKGASRDVYATMQDVTLRVAEAYLEVLRRQSVVRYAKDNLANHQEIFQQIQLRSESGIGRRADLDQARGRLALARTNLITEQANLRDAEANYIRIIGVTPDTLARPEGPSLMPASVDAAMGVALEFHPDLQEARANVQAARADKRAAKSAFYPRIDLEVAGSDDRNTSGSPTNSSSFSTMLRLNYNIFRGGADRARENQSAWRIEEAKQNRNVVQRQVEQSLRISWNAWTSAKASLRYRKEHAEASERTRDAYRNQFSIGQRTLLDLLDSENELFSARSAFIASLYTELLGRYRVLQSMGRLTETLNIPVPDEAKFRDSSWFDNFF